MIRKLVIRAVIVALAGAVTAEAVELAVADLIIPLDGTGTLVVSGSIAGDETFGLTIVLEISSRAGNIGTVEFTNAPPVDIVQLGDPWPGAGVFTAFDTNTTWSPIHNGSVDENGTGYPGPVTFSGALSGFPVLASSDAEGVWDASLTTSTAGPSSWEGLPTTRIDGTITVPARECLVSPDCDDGLYCNGAETCDSYGFCQPGTAPNCDDGVGCTNDSCDEVNDQCVNAPNNGLCDNGQFCDGAETCDPVPDFAAWLPCLTGPDVVLSGGCEDMDLDADDDVDLADFSVMQQRFSHGCQAGTPVDCSDSVGCTVDSCDEVNDTCVNAASNGLCDDSNVCTVDTCNPVNGCDNDGTGITIPCDDGDPCTDGDVCQGDAAGTCQGTLVLLRIENLEVFYAGRFADEPDPSKYFLADGSVSTNGNITNYASGVTGIRVFFNDLVQFSAAPADAFAFEWTTGMGTTFSPVPSVAEKISVTDAVEAGRSVVTIISSNGYMNRRWLKVTVDSAQVSTNGCELDGDLSGNPVVLPGGDGTPGGDAVFYLGNLPCDVNGDRKVTLTDVDLILMHVNPFLPVPITNIYDVDKDGKVTGTDVATCTVDPFFTLPLIAP